MADGDREPLADADVCVVGAGPAGALVAHRLAERGRRVVVLEAGKRFGDHPDADGSTAADGGFAAGGATEGRLDRMERALGPTGGAAWPTDPGRDAYTTAGRHYPLNVARVKGVGGSTLHWQGMVMRLHELDFRRRSARGVGVDWPLSYADLRPYYAAAERALGVAGAADNPFAPPRGEPFPLPAFRPSYSDSLFAPTCEALGVATHSVGNARNSRAYDGRAACQGYGTCQPVCPSGAKYDATVHVRKAEAAGARVLDRTPVQRLEHDDAGESVVAAVYATPDGDRRRQTAEGFVLAAGGVETPRLLLLSSSPQYPDGLANDAGHVGEHFMDHLFAGAGGTLNRPTRQNHVGFNTTESHQFYDDPAAGTDRGVPAADAAPGELGPIKLEFLNYAGPSPSELAVDGDDWGDALLADLRDGYGTHVAVGGLVGQLPDEGNRVTLDRSRFDDYGNPVPRVEWSLSARTRRTIERANAIQHAVLDELGADVGWTVGPRTTGPAYHHMGTARMSADPADGVTDPRGRTHDLDNLWVSGSALFPTGGAMNPTLTIAALALRVADGVDDALARG